MNFSVKRKPKTSVVTTPTIRSFSTPHESKSLENAAGDGSFTGVNSSFNSSSSSMFSVQSSYSPPFMPKNSKRIATSSSSSSLSSQMPNSSSHFSTVSFANHENGNKTNKISPTSSSNEKSSTSSMTTSSTNTSSPAATQADLSKLLVEFVTTVCNQRSQGVHTHYSTLCSQLESAICTNDQAAMTRWFDALALCTSRIGRGWDASLLLSSIWDVSYKSISREALRAYCRFLLNYFTAAPNGTRAIHDVMRACVKSFLLKNVPPPSDIPVGETNGVSSEEIDANDIVPPSEEFSSIKVSISDEMKQGTDDSSSQQENAASEQKSDTSTATPFASMEEIHDSMHITLQRVLQLSPSSTAVLFPLLTECFPHRRLDAVTLVLYAKNLLRVAEYANSLREKILASIIEHYIQIDVEIGSEEEERMNKQQVDSVLVVLNTDHLNFLGNTANFSELSEETQENIDKLDALMCLLLSYLQLLGTSSGAGSSNGSLTRDSSSAPSLCDDVFSSLLLIFQRVILRTHRSRYTQFILFYFCSLRHVYAEAFLRWLLEKTFDANSSSIDRQACAMYVGSFVARAAYLRQASTTVAFDILLEWVVQYSNYYAQQRRAQARGVNDDLKAPPNENDSDDENEEGETVGPLEAFHHSIFYRCVQSLLYIFLYRHSSFTHLYEEFPEAQYPAHSTGNIADPHATPFEQLRSRLESILYSPLNPLRYCLPQIVEEFARITRALELIDCDEIMKQNNDRQRKRMASVTSVTNIRALSFSSASNSASNLSVAGESEMNAIYTPQDSSFPFDPFFLPQSSSYLKDFYYTYHPMEDPVSEDENADVSDDEFDRSSVDGLELDMPTHSPGFGPAPSNRLPTQGFRRKMDTFELTYRAVEEMEFPAL